MINYVIINGVNSNTKNGLMINELPPITKPSMRTNIEEIDGRDGDIITKLGYSAYDKTITIGLWGTSYDVNDIIAFFNKEGVITFSNEPDKYYKFTMLEQIDIERLLKFKTASITFHCQPFKYPTEETPIEIEYEYVEQDNVESANMTNTEGDTFLKIDLKGNTSQYTTTGKNKINYIDNLRTTKNGLTSVINEDGSITTTGKPTADYTCIVEYNINDALEDGETYTLWQQTPQAHLLYLQVNAVKKDGTGTIYFSLNTGDTYKTFVADTDTYNYIMNIQTEGASSWGGSSRTITNKYMLEKSSVKTTFEPFTGGIPAPNPSYPYPIHEVSGDNEIVVCGKNWLSVPFTQFTTNTLRTELPNFIPGTYTFSFEMANLLGDQVTARKIVGGVNTQIKAIYNGNTLTFDLDEEATLQLEIYKIGILLTDISNVMLERGSTKTTYEEYQGLDTYELDLGVENLFEFGNQTFTQEKVLTFTNRPKPNTYTFSSLITSDITSGNVNVVFVYDDNSTDSLYLAPNTGKIVSGTKTTTKDMKQIILRSAGNYSESANKNATYTDIQLEEGTKANSYSPFGQTPIKMRGIGTYEDYFVRNSGKNLLQLNDITLSANSTTDLQLAKDLPIGTYNFNGINIVGDGRFNLYGVDENNTQENLLTNELTKNIVGGYSFTTTKIYKQVKIYVNVAVSGKIQLEQGNSVSTYEPYGTGQWCKYNAIGKVVLDGSESGWVLAGSYKYANPLNILSSKTYDNSVINAMSNQYQGVSWNIMSSATAGLSNLIAIRQDGTRPYLRIMTTQDYTLDSFKALLNSSQPIVYYVLATPYLSLIEDETLISQLDNIQNAMSYEGTTNIGQVNNDLPFIMDLKAMKKDTNETIVNNIGNTTSKPTIALEGTGDINIYLNGTQMLKATLTDKMTIDTTNLEAYNPDTMTLLNRHLVGDISKFTLNSGENTIKMDGDLTKATITDYTRWL